ncbi:hypothetical protein RHMOL_Rhmol07G0170100 [Rhododendron molle]|uniref:Uncharacterized protein n=1 Tax=Rhododendron molle TaxID=49168 RepID=A0ACC0N1U3_RHOML|nr:hypothetical protein RHMOL_Rhmol07G0170100 [Rhododendron molle]
MGLDFARFRFSILQNGGFGTATATVRFSPFMVTLVANPTFVSNGDTIQPHWGCSSVHELVCEELCVNVKENPVERTAFNEGFCGNYPNKERVGKSFWHGR